MSAMRLLNLMLEFQAVKLTVVRKAVKVGSYEYNDRRFIGYFNGDGGSL